MKRILVLTAALFLGLSALAQQATNTVWVTNYVNVEANGTNAPIFSGPLVNLWDAAKMTNVITIGFGEMNLDDTSKFGGGLAVGYRINDYLVPFVRIGYIDKNVTTVSATAQLQLPVTLFGKVTAIPLTYAGTGTSVSGKGGRNGDVVGILGAGAGIRIGSRFDILATYELQTGSGIMDHLALFGVGYKFGNW